MTTVYSQEAFLEKPIQSYGQPFLDALQPFLGINLSVRVGTHEAKTTLKALSYPPMNKLPLSPAKRGGKGVKCYVLEFADFTLVIPPNDFTYKLGINKVTLQFKEYTICLSEL